MRNGNKYLIELLESIILEEKTKEIYLKVNEIEEACNTEVVTNETL